MKAGEASGAFKAKSEFVANELKSWSPVFDPDKEATALFCSIAFVIAPFAIAVAFPTEVTTPVKLALVVAEIFVNCEPSPLKLVAINPPVLGTKDNLVLETFCGKLPLVPSTNVG